MRDVAIIGASMTRFGKYPERGLKDLSREAVDAALKAYESSPASNGGKPPFFEGEMLNLGLEYFEKGQTETAIKIFELNLNAHPNSYSSHRALGEAYARFGKKDLAAKSYKSYLEANQGDLEVVDKVGLKEALQLFGRLKQEQRLSENAVNLLGYQLLNANRTKEAIEVFKFNVSVFPQSGNVYDSLGEAYMKAGENEKAVENYSKSLTLDPANKNAEEMLKKLNVKI